MSVSKLTLIGLYNYDKSLLDGLSFEDVDSDTLKNILLMECGEFELLYPNLEFMKSAMSVFSNKWKWTVKKWTDALKIKYAPLENYDRFESYGGKETIKNSGNETVVNSGNSISKHEEKNEFGRSGTDVNNLENTVSAYNSSTYQPESKTDNSTTHGLKEDNKNSVTDTVTPNLSETRMPDLTEVRTPELENHIHGNVGVTTSQQMLQSELDLALWNLYENIVNLFKAEYCIMTY